MAFYTPDMQLMAAQVADTSVAATYDEDKNSVAIGSKTTAVGNDQIVSGKYNIPDYGCYSFHWGPDTASNPANFYVVYVGLSSEADTPEDANYATYIKGFASSYEYYYKVVSKTGTDSNDVRYFMSIKNTISDGDSVRGVYYATTAGTSESTVHGSDKTINTFVKRNSTYAEIVGGGSGVSVMNVAYGPTEKNGILTEYADGYSDFISKLNSDLNADNLPNRIIFDSGDSSDNWGNVKFYKLVIDSTHTYYIYNLDGVNFSIGNNRTKEVGASVNGDNTSFIVSFTKTYYEYNVKVETIEQDEKNIRTLDWSGNGVFAGNITATGLQLGSTTLSESQLISLLALLNS